MNFYKIKTPIIKKNYTNTTSCKFKGDLEFITNEHGIILDWKISFTKVFLDQYTTQSWFEKKTVAFARREELFEELGLKQIPRPNDKNNKIIELNKEQISIVNNFINNRSKYNSTIKNVVQLLKGNNPGGQAKNPGSAELILDNNSNANVFAILFDNLCLKKTQKESRRNLFDVYSISAKEISFESFVNLNSTLKKAFEYMQVSKDPTGFKIYLEQIETYYKKHNLVVQEVEKIIKKARSKYSVNIDNTITKLPFELKDKAQFQKAHIIDVHKLKMLIIEAKQENKG
ncbi:MAG4270 family putative restriction endonuclease, partial [Mycoplasma marinum]